MMVCTVQLMEGVQESLLLAQRADGQRQQGRKGQFFQIRGRFYSKIQILIETSTIFFFVVD